MLLCGGAINSPQLLLLSGIGPREEIEPHGIPLVHELRGVGRNLQDHLDVSIIDLERTRLSLRLGPRFLFVDLPRALYQYFVHHRGQLTRNVAAAGRLRVPPSGIGGLPRGRQCLRDSIDDITSDGDQLGKGRHEAFAVPALRQAGVRIGIVGDDGAITADGCRELDLSHYRISFSATECA